MFSAGVLFAALGIASKAHRRGNWANIGRSAGQKLAQNGTCARVGAYAESVGKGAQGFPLKHHRATISSDAVGLKPGNGSDHDGFHAG